MRLIYPFEFYLDFANVILAGVAIVFALYMIPLTGKARAWLLFSAALVFLVVDRVLTLLSHSDILFDQAADEVVSDILNFGIAGCLLGSMYYIRGIFLERKLAAETLHKTNSELILFRKLLDNSSDAIEVIDPITARILDVNETECRQLGYSREEMLSMSVFDIDPNLSPDIKKMLDEQIQKSGTARFESIHRRKDGSTFAVEVSIGSANVDKPYGLGIARDITERKKLELDREQYLKFFMLSINPMCIADPHGCLKQVNPAFVQLTGYSASELIAKPFLEFVLPEDRQRTDDEMKLQVESRPTLHFNNRYLCKNGTVIDLSWTAYYDKHNGTSYATAIDITERKRMEESLRKLSLALEQSPSSIVITDLNANIEYVNDGFVKVTGYSRAEVIGENPRMLHSGKTPKTSYQDMWACLTRGEEWKGEFINRHKDGSEYIESVLMSPVRQADGRVSHYLAIKEDITQFKQAQDLLRVSRENLHRLLNSMAEGAYGVDVNGDCTFVNLAFLEMLGYQNDAEVLGKHIHKLIHHSHADGSTYPADECRAYGAYRLGQSINVSDEVFWRKDGVAIPVEYWSHPIVSDGVVTGEIVTFVDITERKQAEDILKIRETELRESQRIARIGSWQWVPATGDVTWSEGMNHVLVRDRGLPPPTFEILSQFYTPESWQRLGTAIAKTIETGEGYDLELEMVCADGTTCWTDTRGEALLGADGSVVKLRGTVHDITERKHAEDALRKSEEQYRLIVETAQEGIWIIDENNKTTFANNKIAELLGYTVEEMHGMSLFDFMDEAGKAISVLNVERRRQGITEQHDFKFQRKDGTDLWVINETNPMVNEDGEYVGALAMITDITARVRSQSQLIEQLDELRRWHEVTSGREERILDLKHEVNDLLGQTGKYPRYPSAESQDKTEK